jgi:hypothetical protein
MQWVLITTLRLAVTDMAPLRELPNTAPFWVCAGAAMVILALVSIKQRANAILTTVGS